MSLDTQPRDGGGRFAEKPDVGIARRMTDALRARLGHDGTDTPPPAVEQDLDARLAAQLAGIEVTAEVTPDAPVEVEVDLDTRLATQLAALDGIPDSDAPSPAPDAEAAAPELVGAGKSLDDLLDHQLAVLDAWETKTAEAPPAGEGDDDEVALFGDDEKIRKWDPDMHPRDGRGRFATIGSTVSLPASLGGGEATVLKATGGGNIRVRKSDGTEVDVPAKDTEVTRSAAANAAERAFHNRPGAETFGGFGDQPAATPAAPAAKPQDLDAEAEAARQAIAAAPLDKPSRAHLAELDRLRREAPTRAPGRTQAEADAERQAINDREARGEFTVGTSVRGPDGRTTITAINPDGSYALADGNTLPGPKKPGIHLVTQAEADAQNAAAEAHRAELLANVDMTGLSPEDQQGIRNLLGPAHPDGSKVTLPDGSVGTVVATGPKGVGVRGTDGKLTVHPAGDLTPAGDVPNTGPTNASALKAGDVVSWHDPDGDVSGTVDEVETVDGTTRVKVDGMDHKLTADAQVDVGEAAPAADALPAMTREEAVAAATATVDKQAYGKDPELRDAAIGALADALMAETNLGAPEGPGSEIAADDGVDRSGWTDGVAPNGADGTGARPDGTAWGSGYDDPADPRNDPAYDQYTTELDAKLEKVLKEIGDTETIHDRVDGVSGAYRPDRQAEHDAMLDEIMAGYAGIPREGKAIVMAGPPGAGKSSLIKAAGDKFGVESGEDGVPTNYAIVNPDDMKELIVAKGMIPPDYPGHGIGDGESATFMHEESSHLATRLLTRLKAEGVNVILDGTFSGAPDKQAGKVGQLKADGYTVTGVLVDGEVSRSLKNAGLRHREIPPAEAGGGYGGRYVPYGLIETNRPEAGSESAVFGRPHRNKASENIEAVQDQFDGGVLWFDNANYDSLLVHQIGPGQTATSGNTEGKSWGELAWEAYRAGVDRSAEVILEGAADVEVKAGGADRNRGNAEALRRTWTHGKMAAQIRWGTDGDHERCVRLVVEHAHFTEDQAHGYCNLREKEATGQYPAQHAARSKALFDSLGLTEAVLEVKVDPPATDPAANAAGVENTPGTPEVGSGATGVMVALYPPDDLAQALALDAEGAEDVSALHVTLAYLGSVEDVGIDRVGDLVTLVRDFAAESFDVEAEVAGIGRWGAGDAGDAFVALVDAPVLPDFRADLVDALSAAGFETRNDHGFTAHVTLAYIGPDAPAPLERLEALPGRFGWLSVAVGADVWDFPLAADDADPAVSAETAPDSAVSAEPA